MSPVKIEFSTYNQRGVVLRKDETIVPDEILAELVTDVGVVTAKTHSGVSAKEGWLNGLLHNTEEVIFMESKFPESGSQTAHKPKRETDKLERKQFYKKENGVETRVSASYIEVYRA